MNSSRLSLYEVFEKLGPVWVGTLFLMILSNLVFLAPAIVWTWWFTEPGIINVRGLVSGLDFLAFWSAAKTALSSGAVVAYDVPTIQALQRELTGIENFGVFPWHYPPTFLLLILPLGLLPYLVALAVWQTLPLLAFVAVMSRLRLPSWTILLVLFSPAVTQSLIAGQNGTLWALILAAAVLNLERHPRLAGVLFGILTFKPHLAVIIGPALLFGRCWVTLVAMTASTLVMAGASLALFGLEPWLNFVAHIAYPTQLLVAGDVPWHRMPTVFASARLIGLGATAAQILQGAVAVVAFAIVAWMWWKRASLSLRCSAMVAAIPLITPFAFDYDMVMLLLPLALMLKEGMKTGWRRGEPALLAFVWLLPVWWLSRLNGVVGLPVVPVTLLLFLAMIWWRAVRLEKSRPVRDGVVTHPHAVDPGVQGLADQSSAE